MFSESTMPCIIDCRWSASEKAPFYSISSVSSISHKPLFRLYHSTEHSGDVHMSGCATLAPSLPKTVSVCLCVHVLPWHHLGQSQSNVAIYLWMAMMPWHHHKVWQIWQSPHGWPCCPVTVSSSLPLCWKAIYYSLSRQYLIVNCPMFWIACWLTWQNRIFMAMQDIHSENYLFAVTIFLTA